MQPLPSLTAHLSWIFTRDPGERRGQNRETGACTLTSQGLASLREDTGKADTERAWEGWGLGWTRTGYWNGTNMLGGGPLNSHRLVVLVGSGSYHHPWSRAAQELGTGQGRDSFPHCPQKAERGRGPVCVSPSLSLLQSSSRQSEQKCSVGKLILEWGNDSVAYLALSPGLLSCSLHPCPPGPKGAGYLTPGCLATAVPGRGVGVWPEVALARERRHGGRRLQGDVGFGEGGPRWAGLLRQREARALGGEGQPL